MENFPLASTYREIFGISRPQDLRAYMSPAGTDTRSVPLYPEELLQ